MNRRTGHDDEDDILRHICVSLIVCVEEDSFSERVKEQEVQSEPTKGAIDLHISSSSILSFLFFFFNPFFLLFFPFLTISLLNTRNASSCRSFSKFFFLKINSVSLLICSLSLFPHYLSLSLSLSSLSLPLSLYSTF